MGAARAETAMRPRDMIENFIVERSVLVKLENECERGKAKDWSCCRKEWKSFAAEDLSGRSRTSLYTASGTRSHRCWLSRYGVPAVDRPLPTA